MVRENSPLPTSMLPVPDSWRELLAILISDPQVRAETVEKTGITEVTLKRWAGKSKIVTRPRAYMLKPLLIAFPEYADLFTQLIIKEFPDFYPGNNTNFSSLDSESGRVSHTLYEHVLAARTTTPIAQLFWSVCNHVLRPALNALDPTMSGVGIWACQCLLSEDETGKREVSCLRERVQFGTAPWKNDPFPTLLLGKESLAGYAVETEQTVVCQDVQENPTFLPVRKEEFEKSVGAFPILFGERVAGCLLVASTESNFFTPTRVSLIERYAQLLSLAFQDSDFYLHCDIHLREMPPMFVQKQHFISFRQRVDEMLETLEEQNHARNYVDAELLVWSLFAKELSAFTA